MKKRPKNCKECEYVNIKKTMLFPDSQYLQLPAEYTCSLTGEDCWLFLENNHIRLDCPVKWEEQK